jgi:VanZ family protein
MPAIPDWFALFSPDKVAHFGAYGVFALLLSVLIFDHSVKRAISRAILIAAAYGVGMEMLQAVSGTGRSFDYVDMVANLLGAMLGGLAFWLLKKITK